MAQDKTEIGMRHQVESAIYHERLPGLSDARSMYHVADERNVDLRQGGAFPALSGCHGKREIRLRAIAKIRGPVPSPAQRGLLNGAFVHWLATHPLSVREDA